MGLLDLIFRQYVQEISLREKSEKFVNFANIKSTYSAVIFTSLFTVVL